MSSRRVSAAPDGPMGRGAILSAGWFAVALVLTTASQLRAGGVPVGPGEFMLLLWMAWHLVRIALRGTVFVPREGRPVLYFWIGVVPLLLAGWLTKVVLALGQSTSAFYDAFAFVFTGASIVVFILQPDLGRRVWVAAACMVVASVLPLWFLLVVGWAGASTIGPLKIWLAGWVGGRFMGWSANPNQTALLMLPMPLIGLLLLSRSGKSWQKLGWGMNAAAAVVVGAATLSDSLALAWGGCVLVLLVLAFYRAASVRTGGILRQGIVRVIIPVLVLAVVGALAPRAIARVTASAVALSGSYQGSDRLNIWMNGLQAIKASPAVGLGPGSHAGHYGPFEGFEAHNTFIDWGSSTGLLGTILYLGLLGWTGFRAFRDGSHLRLLILFSLVVFSTFHYVLRQPSFWFYLLIVAFAAVPGGWKNSGDRDSGALGPQRGLVRHVEC